MRKNKQYIEIAEKLRTHSSMKQFIHRNTLANMVAIKSHLIELSKSLRKDVTSLDKNVEVIFTDKGDFEAEFKFSGDLLIFSMHTNVFTFDSEHPIYQLDCVKEDPKCAYCGLIQIYNFLSDSVKYNRVNDLGYLVGRIFINSDNHFFIEGQERLGFDYRGFKKQVFDQKAITKVMENAILYCLDFELLTPPFEQSSILTLEEKLMNYSNSGMNTGKRLGFEFNASRRPDTEE